MQSIGDRENESVVVGTYISFLCWMFRFFWQILLYYTTDPLPPTYPGPMHNHSCYYNYVTVDSFIKETTARIRTLCICIYCRTIYTPCSTNSCVVARLAKLLSINQLQSIRGPLTWLINDWIFWNLWIQDWIDWLMGSNPRIYWNLIDWLHRRTNIRPCWMNESTWTISRRPIREPTT